MNIIESAIASLLLGLVLGVWGGCSWKGNQVDAEQGRQATAAAQLDKSQRIESTKVETVYVDRIQRVEVPVERVRERIVRAVCRVPDDAGSATAMSGSDVGQPADAAAPTDADAGLLPGIAADAQACLRNAEQLRGLQNLVRVNSAR